MRLYRALLHLFPASFRSEYGDDMRQVFAARRLEVDGSLSWLHFWATALGDLISNSARVHSDLLRQDLVFTRRALLRTPGFALTAITITALGIGAVTAVFSITDHVLIRPLPFTDSQRLVKLWERVPGYRFLEPSPANYRDWRAHSTSFEAMGAFHYLSVNLVGRGEPQQLKGASLTAEVLPLLGVDALMGRVFTKDDDEEDASKTVLLSYGLWQTKFGADPRILGQTIRLGDEAHEVIGVMPAQFRFPQRESALWTPLQFTNAHFEDRDNNYLQAIAKLKPGVSLEEANAEMQVIAARLERQYPDTNTNTGTHLISMHDEVSRHARLMLTVLFVASACLLAITCMNLANLMLARALSRGHELTLRTVLGAGRERLVRQLLTESLSLALVGGSLGIGVALVALPVLTRLVPASLPMGDPSVVNLRVLGFALAATIVSGILFGVIPALQMRGGREPKGGLSSARTVAGSGKDKMRRSLVVAEVSVSMVLLVCAGLSIRALWQIQTIDPGFRTKNVLTLQSPLPTPKYASTERRHQFYNRVLSEVRALPGVSEAGYISFLPMVMRGGIWPVEIDGVTSRETAHTASLRFITSGLFDTLAIPLLAGRDVEDRDDEEGPQVAVVSESFADRYWPGRDPLGRSFHFAFRERTVVGVVGDIRVRGLERRSEPQVYLPHRQVPDGGLIFYAPRSLAVHTVGDPLSLLPEIRSLLQKVDPELPVANPRLFADILSAETASRRTQLQVLALFACTALLLAGIGIHGLLSYAVSQRTAEIGLRMALGAGSRTILGAVVREGLALTTFGASLGLVLAYAAGRSMESLLAGVPAADAVTFVVATGLALTTTLTGSLLPALRAARVDPTHALRND